MAMTLQELQLRAATDEDFRSALKSDPRGTLTKEGINVPDGVDVEIVEATDKKLPIVIPPATDGEISEEALDQVAGGTIITTITIVYMTVTIC